MNITGDKEINNFLLNLDKQVINQVDKEAMLFTKDVQKSAKLRAPRDTGELATSIKFELGKRKGQYIIIVDSPYGYWQEFGFKPHWVPQGTSTKNKLGFTKQGMFVRQHTPFIAPALEFYLNKLNSRLDKATARGIRNAG